MDPAVRSALEQNGGTKETTKALKEGIGSSFSSFVENSEIEHVESPQSAPSWWIGASSPRKIGDLNRPDLCRMLGEYWRDRIYLGLEGCERRGRKLPYFQLCSVYQVSCQDVGAGKVQIGLAGQTKVPRLFGLGGSLIKEKF